jgi:hypothetical protein
MFTSDKFIIPLLTQIGSRNSFDKQGIGNVYVDFFFSLLTILNLIGYDDDYTKLGQELDRKFELMDVDSALRTTIISAGQPWTKRYYNRFF